MHISNTYIYIHTYIHTYNRQGGPRLRWCPLRPFPHELRTLYYRCHLVTTYNPHTYIEGDLT